ncbi:DUF4221 family protein [Phocaeicola sp.]
MKHIIFLLSLFILLFIASCGKKQSLAFDDQVFLEGGDTLVFPLDASTFYNSKAIFQFEDNGKEYLFFQNERRKGIPRIIIFDMEKQNVFKTVPLYEEGPNGIAVISGGWPLDMNHFLVTTRSPFCYMVDDAGNIIKKIKIWNYDEEAEEKLFENYCTSIFYSYYYSPAIIKDSLLFFDQADVGYPRKPEDWKNISMFVYANLNSGKMAKTEMKFPSIFSEEEERTPKLYDPEFSYAYTGKEVAVSFRQCDSLFVSSDFKHVRSYNAKSRYFPSIHPQPYNAYKDLLVWLQEEYLKPRYHHLLYDKYRDVFYRFALMPYQFPKGKLPTGDASGLEFSIIILNNKYEIIGETRFPGNTYHYRMCFVGKKGLYLSLNNQENPNFDENKLEFRCFTLQENK